MSDPRIRRRIARRAAQLMYAREESEYFTAKRKAAREMGISCKHHPRDLPSNAEIRDEVRLYADLMEGDKRRVKLLDMRIDALRLMRKLHRFHPHLIGSVLTGHVREGSDIDIHVFSDTAAAVTAILDEEGLRHDVERKRVCKHHEERVFTHIHVQDRFEYELTLYAADKVNYPFRSSITGKPIERASIARLEQFLLQADPALDLDAAMERFDDHMDPYELYRMLLLPLEEVKQSATHHPEGDALYHSLQVFSLACQVRGYDQEFLLAALLHDVGKGIDRGDHVGAAVAALEGAVTDRTMFFIAHHMEAHAYRDGTLGGRARRRLAEDENIEELLLLSELDQAGRRRGVVVPTIDQAMAHLRSLEDAQ